jgi:hypothetical protein
VLAAALALAVGLAACGDSDDETASTGATEEASSEPTGQEESAAEGTGDAAPPTLPEDACLLDDDLVADLLGDDDVPEPTITFTSGDEVFLEDLVNTDTMILGDLSTCVWDPADVTRQLATYVAVAPGDQYTDPDELGQKMLDRLHAPFEPQDGADPIFQGEVTEVEGVGDEAVQVQTEVGSITWIGARQGGVLAVAATIGDDPDTDALTEAVASLLANGVEATADGTASSDAGDAGDAASRDGSGEVPVTGELISTGDLAATWVYRPGGAFSCSAGIEIPLVADDGSAVGYLEATPGGELTFGSGELGASGLTGTGDVSGYDPLDDEPQLVTVDVDGEPSDGDLTVILTGTLEVQCP